MKKMVKKLWVSFAAVAFAIIAVGTTTYAWFSVTQTATVADMEMEIQSGLGILISLDGENFYTSVNKNTLLEDGTTKLGDYLKTIAFTALTTTDGLAFKKLASTGLETTTEGFAEIDIWVKNVSTDKVVDVTADMIFYANDVLFTTSAVAQKDATDVEVGKKVAVNPINAMRYSINGVTADEDIETIIGENALEVVKGDGDLAISKTVKMSSTAQTATNNYGIAYYQAVTSRTDAGGTAAEVTTDSVVDMSADSTFEAPARADLVGAKSYIERQSVIADLESLNAAGTNETDTVVALNFKFWLEGLDESCFDAILNGTITTLISFKAHEVVA